MPESKTNVPTRCLNRRLLISGWACLCTGLGLLCLSLDLEFILIPPLLIAALVLGFIATIQTRRIGGTLLLLFTVVAPLLFLHHRNSRSTFKEHQVSRTPDVDRGAIRRQVPDAAAGFLEQANDAGPEAGEELTWDGPVPAGGQGGTKTRRLLRKTQTVDAIAGSPDAPSKKPDSPLLPFPAAAQIPAGVPELPVVVSVPLRRPTTRDARAPAVDVPPGEEADDNAWDFPDDAMVNLPFVGREVGDVLDEPLVKECQTNSGLQVGGTLMYTDETNMYGRGWVRNGGTGTVASIPLMVFWFDTNANLISTSRAHVRTSEGIQAGKTLDFGITMPGDPRIASYHYLIVP